MGLQGPVLVLGMAGPLVLHEWRLLQHRSPILETIMSAGVHSPYRSQVSQHQNTRRAAPSLCYPLTCSFASNNNMSQAHAIASSSSSNFQSVFNAALEAYEKKTKCKLISHPLAAQLQSCDSPIAILSVLEGIVHQFDHRRSSDEKLTNWLNPTVNVLHAFSDFIGQGVGIVSLHLDITL